MWQPASISHQIIYHLTLALVIPLAIFIVSASAQTTRFSSQETTGT